MSGFAFGALMLLIDPSVEFLPSASVWTSWQQREETEVCWVWAPARLTRVGLIWLFCCLFLGRWAGEVRGLILTSVRLSEHISQNVQKRFKDKNQDFFLLQLNLKKKKERTFCQYMYCEASHLCRCFTPFK